MREEYWPAMGPTLAVNAGEFPQVKDAPESCLQQDLPAKSNRLESQDAGVIGSQCFPVFAMLLSMISNLRWTQKTGQVAK